MFPIVMSKAYGEKEKHAELMNAWEILGGKSCTGIAAYVPEVGYQNVFFTLLLGLLTMMAYDAVMNQSRWSVWKRTALSTIAILAGMFAAEFLSTDYGALGVLCIMVFYLFRRSR